MSRLAINEGFDGELDSHWTRTLAGGGTLAIADSAMRLALPGATSRRYADAQIDDYTGKPLSRYPWCPPLRLEVRARASHPIQRIQDDGIQHGGNEGNGDLRRRPSLPAGAAGSAPTNPARRGEVQRDTGRRDASGIQGTRAGETPAVHGIATLRGTLGFGFWNFPLTLAGGVPRLPDAVWFFGASPPSNMALVPGMPGCGWKAQVIHAHRWQSLVAGVPALGAMAWGRLAGDDRAAARWVRRVTGAQEALLDGSLTEWHDYALEWREESARFWVDGRAVLTVSNPPPGPLGFVAWIDNQYAVATPRGTFRFGLLESGPEWLELDSLRILPLSR